MNKEKEIQRVANMKKQKASQADFLFLEKNIEAYCSKSYILSLVEETAAKVRQFCRNKKAAFAWSGGKDSIALEIVCKAAGISRCVMGQSYLEFPAFLSWVDTFKPDSLEIIRTGLDIKWLAENQHMLFPQDSKYAAQWFSKVQHKAQKAFFDKHNLDVLVLGRRRADGNFLGRDGKNYYESKGVLRYSPTGDWNHGDVMAAIHYFNMPVPPIYQWKNGYVCGTHSWPARQHCSSVEQGFAEVHEIDNSIIPEAAKYLKPAEVWLNKHS